MPVPPERQAIAEGLEEYEESLLPDPEFHLPSDEDDMRAMADMDAALLEVHLGHSKPHDPNDCVECHWLRPRDEDHDRGRCRWCIKDDAKYIEQEYGQGDSPADDPTTDAEHRVMSPFDNSAHALWELWK